MPSNAVTSDILCTSVIEKIDVLRPEILETSRHLHANPELSGEEYKSSRYLAGRAESHGFAVEHGTGGLPTAFKALHPAGGERDRFVAFLAEYDALPVVGHGCGHNLIGTASTYAAIGLSAVAEHLPVKVALFGTPAEETDGGKITMLNAGAFEGAVAALMAHPGLYNEVAYSSLACISVIAEFHGRSAHAAASPWKGINALDAMIQLFINVDMARKQLPPTVRMPGVIWKGGERANMVPDYAQAQFSLRGTEKEQAELVLQRWIECGEAAARATGARFEWSYDGNAYYDMRPDPKLAEIYRGVWAELGGEPPGDEPRPHGSIDIGNLSHHFPCLHPAYSITHDESVGGHTHEFAAATVRPYAEEQLIRVTKALALTALRFTLS